MANRLDLNVFNIALKKVELSEKKYPMDKAKGNSKKMVSPPLSVKSNAPFIRFVYDFAKRVGI